MTEGRDPMIALSRRARGFAVSGASVVSLAAVWALWPQDRSASVAVVAASGEARPATSAATWKPPRRGNAAIGTFDPRAFEAALWQEPPKPIEAVAVAPPPPPPPPPPLKLQLVGVRQRAVGSAVHPESGGLEAVLLDPETNRVVAAAEGGTVQRYVVRSVSRDAVELVDPGRPEARPHLLKMRSAELRATEPVRARRSER